MRSNRLAIFRVDASASVGLGHLTRCLALADALQARDWDCRFATTSETVAFVHERVFSAYSIIVVPGRAAGIRLLQSALPKGCDLLVVDSYETDVAFEQEARGWASTVLAIDDLPNRQHECDFLLDQTIGRVGGEYAGKIPEACVTLLGPQFTLVRQQFADCRPRSLARERATCRRVLVSFGGTNQEELTTQVLTSLSQLARQLSVDVVLSRPAAPDTTAAVAQYPGAVLWINPDNMAALMTEADLAIGAAGVTSWERCCLGLPAVIVVLAENQRAIADGLAQRGAARVIARTDINRDVLLNAIETIDLRTMSKAAAEVCDGVGAARVASAVSRTAHAQPLPA